MKEAIKQFIFDHFAFLPPELLVVFISALPILELRGGIPVAHQSLPYPLSCVDIFKVVKT